MHVDVLIRNGQRFVVGQPQILFFLLSVDIVPVYMGKVMRAVIAQHGLPLVVDVDLKLHDEVDDLASFSCVDMPFPRGLPKRSCI